MKYFLFLFLLISSYKIYSQCVCEKNSETEIIRFRFPATKHDILLCGYLDKTDSTSLSASEFYVLNCPIGDTVLFFDALQNCRIEKRQKQSLSIIETKVLFIGIKSSWQTCDYLEYRITESESKNIKIDTVLRLNVPQFSKDYTERIYNIYNGNTDVSSSEFPKMLYGLLFLALKGDKMAVSCLSKIKDRFHLDGEYGEMNTEVLDMFNVCKKLTKKQELRK